MSTRVRYCPCHLTRFHGPPVHLSAGAGQPPTRPSAPDPGHPFLNGDMTRRVRGTPEPHLRGLGRTSAGRRHQPGERRHVAVGE